MVLFCFTVTGAIGVPVHEYARGYLGGTQYQSIWYMDAYLIPCALMLTFVGNLRQRFGMRRLSVLGPALFSFGLLGASMAMSSGVFISLRIVQGIGAAVCAAVGGGYLNGGIGSRHSQLGKGLFIMVFAFGATSGVALAGYITWYLSWRVVYAGLGLLLASALILIIRYLPDSPGDPDVTLDWLTFALICSGFGLFSFSLTWGNQHEWFEDAFYCIQLSISMVCITLFLMRLAGSPPLLNPKVFKDINFCISCANLTLILFAVFLVFAIVPTFMVIVVGNTVETYAGPFAFFSLATVASAFLCAPGVNPWCIGRSMQTRKLMSSAGVAGFGITALWMANTTAFQNNINLSLQLIGFGVSFGLILNELLMCFATMPAELTVTASSVSFFGTNIAKSVSGGVSGAISTASSQGSWDRFRGPIEANNNAIASFHNILQENMINGIHSSNWSQASMDLINQAIAKQAEVVSFTNTATLTGFLLLAFSVLPLLHREGHASERTPH